MCTLFSYWPQGESRVHGLSVRRFHFQVPMNIPAFETVARYSPVRNAKNTCCFAEAGGLELCNVILGLKLLHTMIFRQKLHQLSPTNQAYSCAELQCFASLC